MKLSRIERTADWFLVLLCYVVTFAIQIAKPLPVCRRVFLVAYTAYTHSAEKPTCIAARDNELQTTHLKFLAL